MSSHIPLVESDHVIGLDGKPLALLPVNAWAGLPFEVHPHMRKGEVAKRYNPHPLILLRTGTHGRSRIRSGQTVYELNLAPGQIDAFSAGFQMDHGWWDCTPGEVMAVEIDPQRVHECLDDDLGAFAPVTELAFRDPVLERLLACIRIEVDQGCGSGRLFAEGLSLSLLARLAARYGRPRVKTPAQRKLAPAQLNKTIEFIDAHLGSDLTVAMLARQLAMSAHAFAQLFKATVGATPHSFVLMQRIQRAEVLLSGEMSLSDIALTTGFASQSHFTEAFRRRTGRTPSKARHRD